MQVVLLRWLTSRPTRAREPASPVGSGRWSQGDGRVGLGSAAVVGAGHARGAIVMLRGDGVRPVSPVYLRCRSMRGYMA